MKNISAGARLTFAGLCTIFLIIAGQDDSALSQESTDFPTSSVFAVAIASDTSSPVAVKFPRSELDAFVYMPVAFRPAILSGYAQQVVELTNQERARAGCQPLRINPQLVQAAQGHSEDMAFNDFFSHTGSDGSAPWDRIEDTGYEWREAGENIAAGYMTPQAVMNGWMDSDGHRANILRCSYEEIGVGYIYIQSDPGSINYRHYWTQVFARPR